MTGFIDGINYRIGWCISGGLGTGLDGYSYIITLGIDFSYTYVESFNGVKLGRLLTRFQYYINGGVEPVTRLFMENNRISCLA